MNKQNKLTQLAVVYHPGETLGEKLKEMGMSIKEFAVRTTKPEKTIIAVIKGTSSITSEMAVSFENEVLGLYSTRRLFFTPARRGKA